MHTDILIIGQGICGTFLSWYAQHAGLSSIVIDQPQPHTASKAAAGIINPVTGRRIVKTWMIDELIPFVQDAYGKLGADLGSNYLSDRDVVDFFPTPQMRLAFLKRYEEDPQYVTLPTNENDHADLFRYDFGYGVIKPCWMVDLPGLLNAWRQKLQEQQRIREERFEQQELKTATKEASLKPGSIHYKDIEADRVVFCDGITSAGNPYFSLLPFAPNKGEALIIDIPDWPKQAAQKPAAPTINNSIFKQGMTLAPWQDGLFWVGSSYEWSFTDPNPTTSFRERTEALLKGWLKLPFTITGHIASVRPATLERRPFVGWHPRYPAIGILNGMGTKGCSLAPFFAHQLVQNIINGTTIQPDADIYRFKGVLSRS